MLLPDRPRSLIAAATGLLLATPALAAEGPYIGIQGGVSLPTKSSIETSFQDTNASGDVKFKAGPHGGIVVGYGFANGIQPEAEVGYQRNTVKGGGGDVRAATAIGNLYYNFSQNGYYFYLGGGAGYANLRLNQDGLGGDSDYLAVYQAGAGVGFAATEHLLVGVDYRYRGTFDRASFSYDLDGAPLRNDFHYRTSLVSISLRYAFGTGGSNSGRQLGTHERVQVVPVQ